MLTFVNEDEVLEVEKRAREAADARVKPWQAALKPGDFIVKASRAGIFVYGEILAEPPDPEAEGEPEELGNYRFGRFYSSGLPDGEFGYFHVATAGLPLTAEQFGNARKLGWPSP